VKFHPIRTLPCNTCGDPVETRSPSRVCCEPCRSMGYRGRANLYALSFEYDAPNEFKQRLRRPITTEDNT